MFTFLANAAIFHFQDDVCPRRGPQQLLPHVLSVLRDLDPIADVTVNLVLKSINKVTNAGTHDGGEATAEHWSAVGNMIFAKLGRPISLNLAQLNDIKWLIDSRPT